MKTTINLILKIFAVVALIIIFTLLVEGVMKYGSTKSQIVLPIPTKPVQINYKNMTYIVGGNFFTLVNGKAEKAYTAGSASKNILRTFGEPVYGDLNGDGVATDMALWLENNPGGSGTFYYAVLIMNNSGVYKPTGTMLLGDRIAPQTLEIHDGRAVYNFAERNPTEPMTTPPSLGRSVWVNYDVKMNEIGEWAKDFEGEAANNNIIVSNPIANTKITSPLVVKGEAKGTWFFEASFPVVLTDWDGKIIAEGIAKAESDWMTTSFVPFTATLTFTKPSYGATGSLILKKDNPSGLPQNDDSLEIAVKF